MLWTRPLTVWRLLALLLASELVRTGFVVSVLPVAGPSLGFSTALIGLMVGAHYLADALAKGPLGLVTERWGLGRLLTLGAVLGLAVVVGTRLAPSPVWLVVGGAAWGVAYAALWPGVMGASQAFARPKRTARALSVSNLVATPAILAGILLVGPLMQTRPDTAWAVLLGVQVTALVLALTLWRLHLPKQEGAETARNPWAGWSRVAVLLPAAFAQTLAPGLVITLIYPLLARLQLPLPALLLPGILFGVTLGLSLWLAGRLADRSHPRRALAPGLLLLALAFALAALPGLPQRLPLVALILGVGYGAFIAGWNGLVARTLPTGHRAAAWGTVMATESLGNAIGPLLGGAAWQLAGPAGVFGLGAAVFVLTEVYYLWPGRKLGAKPVSG
ncbi:MFS transporter [Deinococcus puniceus]|uniref:MFS transporter n=1 Tax=Deinococcus puniceus TaxID=1182568 RepID=A0A172T6H3_9DEIO|nr:MFS transporter [Deinococcus puniceus]ANE42581.1 MFS transporter [Deinococcus puniceus]